MHRQKADDTELVYSYACYNVNRDGWEAAQKGEDGRIVIARETLAEPKSPWNQKRRSGRKKRTEDVMQEFSLQALLDEKKITVKNARGTWRTDDKGIDMIAQKLLFKFFCEYRRSGVIPADVSFFV